jgi:GNAT superfamily N-acetyltransferase
METQPIEGRVEASATHQLQIRRIQVSDYNTLYKWFSSDSVRGHLSPQFANKKDIEKYFSSTDRIEYMAVDTNDKLVGTFTLIPTIPSQGKVAWLEKVVVDPDRQGQGIGKKMLGMAIDAAFTNHGVLTLNLGVVTIPGWQDLCRLYANNGFTYTGTYMDYILSESTSVPINSSLTTSEQFNALGLDLYGIGESNDYSQFASIIPELTASQFITEQSNLARHVRRHIAQINLNEGTITINTLTPMVLMQLQKANWFKANGDNETFA